MKGWYRVMSMTGKLQNHGQQKKGDVHKIIRILLLEDGGSGTEAPVLRTWRRCPSGIFPGRCMIWEGVAGTFLSYLRKLFL